MHALQNLQRKQFTVGFDCYAGTEAAPWKGSPRGNDLAVSEAISHGYLAAENQKTVCTGLKGHWQCLLAPLGRVRLNPQGRGRPGT